MNDRDRLLSLRAVAVRLSLYKRDGETPNIFAVRNLIDTGQLNIIKLSERRSRISESNLNNFLSIREENKK